MEDEENTTNRLRIILKMLSLYPVEIATLPQITSSTMRLSNLIYGCTEAFDLPKLDTLKVRGLGYEVQRSRTLCQVLGERVNSRRLGKSRSGINKPP